MVDQNTNREAILDTKGLISSIDSLSRKDPQHRDDLIHREVLENLTPETSQREDFWHEYMKQTLLSLGCTDFDIVKLSDQRYYRTRDIESAGTSNVFLGNFLVRLPGMKEYAHVLVVDDHVTGNMGRDLPSLVDREIQAIRDSLVQSRGQDMQIQAGTYAIGDISSYHININDMVAHGNSARYTMATLNQLAWDGALSLHVSNLGPRSLKVGKAYYDSLAPFLNIHERLVSPVYTKTDAILVMLRYVAMDAR